MFFTIPDERFPSFLADWSHWVLAIVRIGAKHFWLE
jgi:hypothetical protein